MRKVIESTLVSLDGVIGDPHRVVSALVVVGYVSLDGVIQAPACRRDPEGVTVVATYA